MKPADIVLPELMLFSGNWDEYINAIYEVFKNDFLDNKTRFNKLDVNIKWRPVYQDRPSTFYHITHEGKDESNRTPDIRRCERVPWVKPVIDNCQNWDLKYWPQKRRGRNRICIWLNLDENVKPEQDFENHYFIILEKRKEFFLLWSTFMPKYPHDIRAKQKEYNKWFVKMQKSPERRS